MINETKPILPLNLVSPGKEVVIKAIVGGRQIRNRLMDMGLVKGSEFQVLKNFQPGPCIIGIGNSRIALGRGISEKIIVMEKE